MRISRKSQKTKYVRCRLHIRLVALFMLLAFNMIRVENISGQENIRTLCGDFDITGSTLPDPFPGAYYHMTQAGVIAPDYVWRFERITQEGRTEFEAPFSSELAQSVYLPRISPDERRMVFAPFRDRGKDLIVWDLQTGEVASLGLNNEISEYLGNVDDRLVSISFQKLIWQDASHILIQDFRGNDLIPVNQIVITVSEEPLLLSGTIPGIGFSQSDNVQSDGLEQSVLSPQNEFTAVSQQTSNINGISTGTLKVFDNENNLVFDVQSNVEANIVGKPIWLGNGDTLFYRTIDQPSGSHLVQINVDDGFQRSIYLDRLLESTFGSSSTLSTLSGDFPPMLSNDGQSIGFQYLDANPDKDAPYELYVIKYTVETGEVVAVCDDLQSGGIYPFWVPGDDYLAYWQGSIKVFDFSNGNRYVLPARGFVGWVQTNPSWSLAQR